MTAVQYLNPSNAAPAQGLYSHAARVPAGDLIFVAGQLAVAPDGGIDSPNDFDAQFRRVFGNLRDVIEGVGCTPADIIKFTTFLVHSQDIPSFMRLRAAYFPEMFGSDVYPPNTLLIVDRLVKEDFLLEVEAVLRAPPA
jgi:enamine deaminase RidA (YjgF/YER057c/UK114 family)